MSIFKHKEKDTYTFNDLAVDLGISKRLTVYYAFINELGSLATIVAKNSKDVSLHEFAHNNRKKYFDEISIDRKTYILLLNEIRKYVGILDSKEIEENLSNQRKNITGTSIDDYRISVLENGKIVAIQRIITNYSVEQDEFMPEKLESYVILRTFSTIRNRLLNEVTMTYYDCNGAISKEYTCGTTYNKKSYVIKSRARKNDN